MISNFSRRLVRLLQLSNAAIAGIGGEDKDGPITKRFTTPLVNDPAFIEEIQKRLPDIRMTLFSFIQQKYGVRVSQQVIDQASAVFMPHISGRDSDQPGDRIRFGEVSHRVHFEPSGW